MTSKMICSKCGYVINPRVLSISEQYTGNFGMSSDLKGIHSIATKKCPKCGYYGHVAYLNGEMVEYVKDGELRYKKIDYFIKKLFNMNSKSIKSKAIIWSLYFIICVIIFYILSMYLF